MKSILTTMLVCMFSTTIQATILVVDNNINNTTVYAVFNDAVAAAIGGDTIYVQPSNISYGVGNIDKQLVVFGAGRRPNKQNQSRSVFTNLFLNVGSSGSEILGIVADQIAGDEDVSSITIAYCQVGIIVIAGDNFFVENCVLRINGGFDYSVRVLNGMVDTPRNNLVFQNNVIRGGIRQMDGSGCVFRNNLFIPASNYTSVFFSWEPSVSIIMENNIFYGTTPTNCFVCTFNNNISFASTQDTLPYNNNSGTNNLIWLQNNFVDADLPITNFVYNIYGYDLEIADGEAGSDAGLDGNDIGLFGGAFPFSYAGEPAIPVVRNFVLENASVPVDGNIQIQVLLSAPE